MDEAYEQAKRAKHLVEDTVEDTASPLGNSIRPLPGDASDKTLHDLLMGDLCREQTPENGEGVDEYCRRVREEASSRADLWGGIESEGGIKGLWETTKQNGQEVFTNSLGSISASLGGAGLAFYQDPKVLVVPVAFSGFTGLLGAGWGKAAADKISEVDAERRAELYGGLSYRLEEGPSSEVYPSSFSVDRNPFVDLPSHLGGDLGVTEATYYREDGVWQVNKNHVLECDITEYDLPFNGNRVY